MKCVLPDSIVSKCEKFVHDFNGTDNTIILRNIMHDKPWKEDLSMLEKITGHILVYCK